MQAKRMLMLSNGSKPAGPFAKAALAAAMLATCMGGASAAAGDAFDLQCSSEQGRSLNFRFDLQQRRWCYADCRAVWNIDDLSDARIRLTLRSRDGSEFWTIHIDRYTSDFWVVRRGYGSEPQEWGQCSSSPFSGFPQRQF